MSEREEPDWLAELAKGGEALRRQVEPIVQAGAQLARSRWPKISGGSALPCPLRLALVLDANMRSWLPSREPVLHQMTVSCAIIGRGSVALRPMRVIASGDVATASESAAVAVLDSRRGMAAQIDEKLVALVLVWLFAFALPWLAAELPLGKHEVLSDSLATFAIALDITWRIRDKSK